METGIYLQGNTEKARTEWKEKVWKVMSRSDRSIFSSARELGNKSSKIKTMLCHIISDFNRLKMKNQAKEKLWLLAMQ